MNYCPLMSYAKQYAQEIPCLGEECALAADGAGECLIKQALQLYVSGERTRRAEEEERSRQEMEAALAYWKMRKDGRAYEDLSPMRDNDLLAGLPLTYKPTTTAPAVDGNYITF